MHRLDPRALARTAVEQCWADGDRRIRGTERRRLLPCPATLGVTGPGERRQITAVDESVQLLAIGGTCGAAYSAPEFTQVGATLPG